MQSLPLTAERQNNRLDESKNHSKKQQFPRQRHNATKITNKTKTHKTRDNETKTETNKKWAFFTQYNPTIRKVTNLFKHTDVDIAFRSTNTLYKLTKPKPHIHIREHNKNGIYALTCNTCKQAYIGQTSRNLRQRYQEHIRYTRNNDPQSAYALHILKIQHKYGPMNDTMTLLKYEQKTLC
jgi:hypothetical protein